MLIISLKINHTQGSYLRHAPPPPPLPQNMPTAPPIPETEPISLCFAASDSDSSTMLSSVGGLVLSHGTSAGCSLLPLCRQKKKGEAVEKGRQWARGATEKGKNCGNRAVPALTAHSSHKLLVKKCIRGFKRGNQARPSERPAYPTTHARIHTSTLRPRKMLVTTYSHSSQSKSSFLQSRQQRALHEGSAHTDDM